VGKPFKKRRGGGISTAVHTEEGVHEKGMEGVRAGCLQGKLRGKKSLTELLECGKRKRSRC